MWRDVDGGWWTGWTGWTGRAGAGRADRADRADGADGTGVKGDRISRLRVRGYAAFLQNAGLERCGTQSVAQGWDTVSRWDTGRR